MIEVAGVWEQGWNSPITESTEWEMMLREYGVDTLNMTPVSGIAAPWGNKPWLSEYDNMAEVLSDHSHLTPVFVDEAATVDLVDFQHPEDALYVFGRAGYSPYADIGSGHLAVKIVTPCPGCLWAHQACALLLHDRFIKAQ